VSGDDAAANYLDFELEISPGNDPNYQIAVVRSPAGEARGSLRLPFGTLEVKSFLKDLQIALLRSASKRRGLPSIEEQAVQQFGQNLFDALLAGEVRSRYDVSLSRAEQQGKRLRLKLRIQPPELAALPWEYLYDPRKGEYLCLARSTPIVRYLELAGTSQPLAVKPPLRILGMISSPAGLPPLDVAREKLRMEEATRELRARGLVELAWLKGSTWRDLQRALRRGPWHIFHFLGHGGFDTDADEGLVALAHPDGETHRLHATALGRLLADHFPLRMVLLNACEGARGSEREVFSSTAAVLVRRGIPAVLAMQHEISDEAAVEFAQAFYEALADGLPVDAAVSEARIAVSIASPRSVEWGTPVLYTRAPDGVLFDIHVGIPFPEPREQAKQDEQPPASRKLAGPGTGRRQHAAENAPQPERQDVVKVEINHPSPQVDEPVPTSTRLESRVPTLPPKAHPAARKLITAGNAGHVRSLRILDQHTKGVHSVAFAPNGQALATGSGGLFKGDNTVRVWQSSTGKLLHTLTGHTKQVIGVLFAPDGSSLASWAADEAVGIWELPSGKKLGVLSHEGVLVVLFAPQANVIATAGPPFLKLWRRTGKKRARTLHGHTGYISSMAFAPDGHTLVSGDSGGTIRIWQVDGGACLHVLHGHTGIVSSVAFSPDGKFLASGSWDKTVKIWRTSDGTCIETLRKHSTGIEKVAFSPDAQFLATMPLGADDRAINIWRLSDWKLHCELEGHRGALKTMAFAPDGQILTSGGYDKTIRLWRPTDGTLLCTLTDHVGMVNSLAFSPDGTLLASGSDDRTARLWGIK
jgi:WD40 repeat protein